MRQHLLLIDHEYNEPIIHGLFLSPEGMPFEKAEEFVVQARNTSRWKGTKKWTDYDAVRQKMVAAGFDELEYETV